jgi:hypothetical protein
MLDINYFLRAIRRETLEIVGTQVNVEDVKDELFDIVKPANSDRITVDDLIACRQGGTGLQFPCCVLSFDGDVIICCRSCCNSL